MSEDLAVSPAGPSTGLRVLAVLLGFIAFVGCVPILALFSLAPTRSLPLSVWMLGSITLGAVNLWLSVRYFVGKGDRGFFGIYAANSMVILLAGWLLWP